MFGDDRISVGGECTQLRREALVPAVAHGDRSITPQAGELCALDRRMAEGLSEGFDVHPGDPFQRRIDELIRGLERPAHGSTPVPRADVLADVAAEDVEPACSRE